LFGDTVRHCRPAEVGETVTVAVTAGDGVVPVEVTDPGGPGVPQAGVSARAWTPPCRTPDAIPRRQTGPASTRERVGSAVGVKVFRLSGRRLAWRGGVNQRIPGRRFDLW
jgi:hypothetical protein